MADFSIIPELKNMYTHCKATEDKDMSLVDFVTDHIMNIDGIFDQHNNGDEQKPHQNITHQLTAALVSLPSPTQMPLIRKTTFTSDKIQYTNTNYNYEHVGLVFRPPNTLFFA